jgi:hypothetical protein
MTNPIVVPMTARTIFVPVVNALLRNTDIAPSTTQKPCCTGNTCVIATATASPRPVRTLLRSATDRVATNPVMLAAAAVSESTRSDAPVSGRRRPSARAHTGRASAAAAAAITRPVAPIVAAMARRVNSVRPTATADSSLAAPSTSTMSSR